METSIAAGRTRRVRRKYERTLRELATAREQLSCVQGEARRSGVRRLMEVLLVEDNPGDVRLTREALAACAIPNTLRVVHDGEEAVLFLRGQGAHAGAKRPDLILLDFNLPRKDGSEVLSVIKADVRLRSIPVVVLTTSDAARDIERAYDLHANCYVTKPLELDRFLDVVRTVSEFWLNLVKLPEGHR